METVMKSNKSLEFIYLQSLNVKFLVLEDIPWHFKRLTMGKLGIYRKALGGHYKLVCKFKIIPKYRVYLKK